MVAGLILQLDVRVHSPSVSLTSLWRAKICAILTDTPALSNELINR